MISQNLIINLASHEHDSFAVPQIRVVRQREIRLARSSKGLIGVQGGKNDLVRLFELQDEEFEACVTRKGQNELKIDIESEQVIKVATT